jgi:arylsulfatase
VVQQFQDLGKLDNTLIIYINGDNGTSAEGGPLGTPNEVAFFNGLNKLPADVQLKFYEVWGTDQTYNHMSAGWSWAFDTPFDWFKQNASRLGGINQNMVVSWPARIKDKGALRQQFVHVIDVVPTILEAAGIRPPEVVDGIKQAPIEGTSFLYTFDPQNAKTPSRHTTQYFEMFGQWALYKDGWVLSTKVNRAPWEAFGPANPDPLNNQVFQLYNLNEDFSQTQDIAAQNPQKVKEMRQEFLAEAKKHQVLPLDASVAARIVAPRPNVTAGRSEFVYTRPMVGLPQGDSPVLLNTSYTVMADIEVLQGGAEGIMLTSGGRFAGYGFYLLKGKPVWLWNLVDLERLKWEGTEALTPGKHTVEFDFKYDGLGAGTLVFNDFSGVGRPGVGTLKVDGQVVATKTMPKTLPMTLQWDESFDIGSDTLTGVNDADYQPPFAFTGKLNKLTVKLDRPQLSPEDIKKLEAAQRNNPVSE